MSYETRIVKVDEMGFANKSLREHLNELDADGVELVAALKESDGSVVLITKPKGDQP